ncbi:MAG: VOC family protein [Alphaproteobacteria bacterium]|nr:VOC family protein [Alphaproteobacteria bacterium]MCB9691317.1 VOC family protein [Alphaproteobacteria bacterium]
MEPILDHIQITVRDLDRSAAFYDRLMPILGYDLAHRSRASLPAHDFEVVEYGHPRLGFALTSPRASVADDPVHRRRPGSVHHIAFRAASPAEVDRLYAEVVAIGAEITDPPKVWPEFVPAPYYAFFFKDPDGIKYEIVHAG